jgi:hypothetical protein
MSARTGHWFLSLGGSVWRAPGDFRSTNALWNLNSVAGLRIAQSFAIRRGLRNSVVSPSRKRSSEVRFGARCRDRLLISNWYLSNRDSAATARTPPGRRSFTKVTSRWMARMRNSRMRGTIPCPPSCARLHGTGGLRHTTNSPPTASTPCGLFDLSRKITF